MDHQEYPRNAGNNFDMHFKSQLNSHDVDMMDQEEPPKTVQLVRADKIEDYLDYRKDQNSIIDEVYEAKFEQTPPPSIEQFNTVKYPQASPTPTLKLCTTMPTLPKVEENIQNEVKKPEAAKDTKDESIVSQDIKMASSCLIVEPETSNLNTTSKIEVNNDAAFLALTFIHEEPSNLNESVPRDILNENIEPERSNLIDHPVVNGTNEDKTDEILVNEYYETPLPVTSDKVNSTKTPHSAKAASRSSKESFNNTTTHNNAQFADASIVSKSSKKLRYSTLTENTKHSCLVTFVKSPLLFWIQSKSVAKDLAKLHKKLKYV
jgi:hypothetical protein